jgi:hemolysin-activating ACP:hemolysin acyltransferase
VLWARVSDEVDQRFKANLNIKLRIRPDEWTTGTIVWIIDTAGEPKAVASALAELAKTQFKDTAVKMVVTDANGAPHVGELQTWFSKLSAARVSPE